MAPSHTEERQRRRYGIRGVAVLTLGIVTALSVGPAYSSGREGRERQDQQGAARTESKFYGTVETIPADRIGTWIVDNRDIMVTTDTIIKEKYGKAEEGAYVEIKGDNTGGTFTAYKIEVKRARK